MKSVTIPTIKQLTNNSNKINKLNDFSINANNICDVDKYKAWNIPINFDEVFEKNKLKIKFYILYNNE